MISTIDDDWGAPMTADGSSLRFGIKTSQAGLGYAEILRVWREADQVPEFEDAWLWDHLVPLRGDVTGPASRPGRCWRRSPRRPAGCGWA